MSPRPAYALQKIVDRTERAANAAGYRVVDSTVLADGTVSVNVVRRRKSGLYRRLYFIQMESSLHIKIGVANNTGKRLKALQTANPERLIVLGTLQGDEAEEAELHKVLAAHRMVGEWFSNGPWLDHVRYSLKWNKTAGYLLTKLKSGAE